MAEQYQRVPLGSAFRGASLQSSDQGPQLVHGLDGASGLAGDLCQANGGVGELHHGGEVGVVCVGHSEDVGGQPEGASDVAAGGHVADRPAPGFDHRNVGLVEAQQLSELMLAEPVIRR